MSTSARHGPLAARTSRRALRGVLVAAAFVALAALAPAAQAQTIDPIGCSGYAEPRVFLESQSWWYESRSESDGEAEHVHSGACFPVQQVVSSDLLLHIRSMLHGAPPGTFVEWVGVAAVQGRERRAWIHNRDRVCEAHDCTFWNQALIDIDGAAFPYSGWTEFKVQVMNKRPDGAHQLATTGWRAYIQNGKPLNPYETDRRLWRWTTGRGWYRLPSGEEFGYENADLEHPVPYAPVSGTWSPAVATVVGFEGQPITSSRVAIDPALHANPEDPGLTVVDVQGPFQDTVSIDTTRLPNGPHKLAIVARADEPGDRRLAGVQVIPFVVENEPVVPAAQDP